MPKTKISEFDTVAANNTDIDGINIGEGMLPSDVNNAIRELMSQLKDFQGGTSGDKLAIAAGGTNAATTTAALQNLGGTTTGINLFKAVSSTVARTELGATTVGGNLFTLSNPSAITFPRFNADNTVSALSATDFRTAIGAGTGSGDVTTTGTQTLTNKTLTGVKVTVSALGTLTTGTTTIDLSTAQVYTATITAGNTITFAFSNAPGAGTSQVVLLRLTNAGGGTIVYPASTRFAAGAAPTLTASGVDVLGVYYDVTTTTYMVFVIGLDVKAP